jgi:hypothetical protein
MSGMGWLGCAWILKTSWALQTGAASRSAEAGLNSGDFSNDQPKDRLPNRGESL